jgi:hypothetical protein
MILAGKTGVRREKSILIQLYLSWTGLGSNPDLHRAVGDQPPKLSPTPSNTFIIIIIIIIIIITIIINVAVYGY